MRIYFAGGGRCTEYMSRRLIREGHDLVLLEQDEERCHQLSERLDARVIRGQVASILDWQRAGLAEADMFMACTRDDQTNVLACLIADDIAPNALKAIRLRSPEFAELKQTFDRLGLRVDRVIHPESDMVNRILRVITVPGVSDIRNFADGRIKLFSMNLEAHSPLIGIKVGNFPEFAGSGKALITVVFRGNEAIIPGAEVRLAIGDHVYIVTSADSLDQTLQRIGIKQRSHIRQVFITGGGEVGLELARALEQTKVSVKLFERDAKRCDYLATELANTMVINADGTSQEVLIQEHIEGVDAFISLTGDEDANLIACLLARRMKVDKVVPLVTSINYLELAQRLGINTTVNPRIKAADALLEFVRKGGVLSVRTLGEEKVEAIELEVPVDSDYVDLPLGELDLPQGSLVGAIARPDGTVLIPDNMTYVRVGDRIVIFTQEGAVRKLERHILTGNS
ncbi:MAG: Trk system potassium transporter TrkA [Thiogranum sp.]